MADLDTIGDLVHHAIDTVTGALKSPSPPPKPAYTSTDASAILGSGMAKKGAETISGRQAQIDKQTADAGG